ncbi:MAG: hypothetical protein GF411_05345 [Candidatus Lokiarchaeota archaeon]|nr:hypothetical protein [Candidatus Lokiarchaeota archaeon]
MVNIRKLQQTGGKNGKSYLIILPKEWIERQKLKKGTPIMIAEREDGCLIIDPRLPQTKETRSTKIQMESNLRWSITSKYLLGFDEILVESKNPITSAQRQELKKIIKRFVALEVTDENENQIVVQCLVDPTTLPVKKAMRRMHVIASRMLREALKAYFSGKSDTAEEVVNQDEEVDRLFFLIVRELRSAIQYSKMSEEMGITPVEALDLRLATQYIERIADLAVDIASRTGAQVETKLTEHLQPVADKVREMLSKSVANLFRFDSQKVAWVIEAEKELIDEIAILRNETLTKIKGDVPSHLYVIDSLLRIGEAAKDIADLALP